MLDMLIAEFKPLGALPLLVMAVRMTGAVLLSGIIGLEREIHKDTAGLRTHMLIGLASSIFAIITLQLWTLSQGDGDALRLDPLRLIEAVTGGVAFLAAGMVVYSRGSIKGLTTGAGMWLASSIGLACGLGYWSVALMACAFGFLVMGLLRRLQYRIGIKESGENRESGESGENGEAAKSEEEGTERAGGKRRG